MYQLHIYEQHIYEPNHPAGAAHLLPRDYLRVHQDEAQRYETLKRGIAECFRTDRLVYSDAKTEYVAGVLRKVGEQKYG